MHAMLVDAGGKFAWSEVPDPKPKADEVLIDVHAAALNRADLMQRAGEYRLYDAYRTRTDANRAKAALEYMQGVDAKVMRLIYRSEMRHDVNTVYAN